jgi:phage gp36-like protein
MYCTVSSVQAEFPQFTAEQWGTGDLPDDTAIEAAITTADALIDDYCRTHYEVPFDPDPPTTISDISLALTVCSLRDRFYRLSPVPDQQATARRAEIIRRLERLGLGQPPVLDWPLASSSESTAGTVLSSTPPDERLFTRDQIF